MTRYLAIASILLLFAGCGTLEGGDSGDTTDELTKSDAAEKLETEKLDFDPCEEYGWYGDGECDAFCPQPDPSCEGDTTACSQVITFGIHPDTGECHEFATPCDVPDGWETSYTECPEEDPEDGEDENGDDPPDCIQVITPAEEPDTGACEEFPTPCDVPDGWEVVESCDGTDSNGETCQQVITYGVDPDTGECYEFATPCDVPDGWETSHDDCPDHDPTLSEDSEECQSHADCMVGGCSGELCHHVDNPMASTCDWWPEYACYDDDVITTCGCFDGTCGWDQTDELDQCLEDKQ